MDTLQIQDAFAPYYAEQPNAIQVEPKQAADTRRDLREMRNRLEDCRARLSRTVRAEHER